MENTLQKNELEKILFEIEQKEIFLFVREGKLIVNAPEGALTSDLQVSIREHRDEIIRWLTEDSQTKNASQRPIAQDSGWSSAEFVLLLTPPDLPEVPFLLRRSEIVMDRVLFLRSIQSEIRRGPRGPRAMYGGIQADIQALRDLVIEAGEVQQRRLCCGK